MSQSAIEVSGVSKRYVIQHESRHDSLRDTLHHTARKIWRRVRWGTRFESEEFWALRDVSFSVQPGEVVGIIGRNGAGKSTLLKILSRITEPTAGKISLRGRVASLLEVGTGFHPDLTGRENIFLNGAILGMRRAEIRRKFDEIVAFAEIERFLDTPVKRYSSGMYVRLAFAVAAHLEPEILIVDEVLAVGDAAFQQKCLGKMDRIARLEGRTILFVSHQIPVVLRLTTKAVLLESGMIKSVGDSPTVIARYSAHPDGRTGTDYDVANAPRKFPGTGEARILQLRFERSLPVFSSEETLKFTLRAQAKTMVSKLRVSLTVFAADGTPIGSGFSADNYRLDSSAETEFSVEVPHLSLAPGRYYLDVAIGLGSAAAGHRDYDVVQEVLGFEIAPLTNNDGVALQWPRGWGNIILPSISVRLGSP